jgi:hypothetical protein
VRGELLTQRRSLLTLGLFVSLVDIHRGIADRCIAQPVVHQPTRIIIQVTVKLLHNTVGDQQEVISRAFEQMTIVRHHQHRTTELLQRHGQGQTHFQVEVVGGFVEQQQIGFVPGNQGQRQPCLLAAREIQHWLVQARTTEVETTEEITQRLLALGRRNALQMQQWAGLGVQRVELVLGKVANHRVLAAHHTTAQRLKLTGKVLDQRGFTGAVRAQQANACSRR